MGQLIQAAIGMMRAARTLSRGRAGPLAAGATVGAVGIPGVDIFGGGGDGVRSRRRRRKMLTAGDLRDLAAIEGIAGKKAAERALLIRIATA